MTSVHDARMLAEQDERHEGASSSLFPPFPPRTSCWDGASTAGPLISVYRLPSCPAISAPPLTPASSIIADLHVTPSLAQATSALQATNAGADARYSALRAYQSPCAPHPPAYLRAYHSSATGSSPHKIAAHVTSIGANLRAPTFSTLAMTLPDRRAPSSPSK